MSKGSSEFTLPASLTIHNAAEILLQLREHDDAEEITLVGSEVENITTPGLQLLAACWQQAKNEETAFHIIDPTPTLKQTLVSAGMNYLLD